MSDFVKDSKDAAEPEDVVEKGEAGEDDEDNDPAPEEESTATFAPVVQLEVVEVKSGEEDEDIVYKERSKLFLYGETLLDKGTGNKTWRERGTGDVKILKHRESGRLRVLMRQDKTMKMIINHFLDPRISEPVPHNGNDKAWVWIAYDFAELELIETTFALKFGTVEKAAAFKAAFVAGQKENDLVLKGADAKEGGQEADEATAALEKLEVKSGEEKE